MFLACPGFDVPLLSALSPSTGGPSRALDDAYQRFYGYLGLPFAFHFITPASAAAEELLAG